MANTRNEAIQKGMSTEGSVLEILKKAGSGAGTDGHPYEVVDQLAEDKKGKENGRKQVARS